MNWIIKEFHELTTKELYEILKSRAEIFVKEQNITYVDEDDVDYRSLHVFTMEENRVIAYLRAFPEGNTVRIGRVLTLNHGHGIGTELVKYAVRELPKRLKCEKICMDAQKRAVPFYEKLGFQVTSDEYMEEGIVHVDMEISI